jgi:alkylation response protein AidB-like acyl-CoA dehydrogenase
MDFNHTEDRRMLQDTLARYVREQYSHDVRMDVAQSDNGYSTDHYNALCELGIAGALLPESVGGFGGAGHDLAVVFEQLGRGLVVEPFLASAVLGARLLSTLAADTQADLITAAIDGSKKLAFAHAETDSRYELNRVAATATSGADGWELSGHKVLALNADSADVLLVSARTAGDVDSETGISVFLIDPKTAGVEIKSYPTVDGYRAADVVLNGAKADAILGSAGDAYAAIESSVAAGVVALCAEALGAMEVCKETTLEYLQTRKQFGVPIGKFQALQHRMVDVLIEIEQARSAVINAAGNLEADRRTRERHVSAAKNLIGRAARLVAEESIQMHGGIAMTWEYSLPHYAKRLIMLDHLLGDTDHHLERFIRFSR